MVALWAILAAMTGAAALLLLWPLARVSPRAEARTADDAAFYRAALADIDRDAARGLIGEQEAGAARTEAARRLLRSDSDAPAQGNSLDAARRRRTLASLLALMLVPAVALVFYGATGSPHLPDQPIASRRAVDPATLDLAQAVARIEAHLQQDPNDGAGYEVIAPVYFRLGRIDDAIRAYSEALRLLGENPDRLANLAEGLIARADGIVTADAKEKLARAAELNPKQPKARYYLALAREQDGDRAGAIAGFENLLADSTADAPWIDAVRERLVRLRGVPSSGATPEGVPKGGEAIANLPPEERAAAIRGMVDGLAQRLASQGGSPDEWARLIRAHMALGEKEKAAKALADARRALSAEAVGDRLDALSREFGL
ncbi:c-type cytochrome biogenesis protein CcmI [Terrarubrum flagellatum]|uniref:c-type cytochrome biogenesis protein CcmI n=1 Tax=Terrirubrum flagellatum TaxID=2895980 RepID=UPI00314529FB